MFDFGILDVAIGLAFLYMLLSLLCSEITELISRLFAMRSKNLMEGIKNLLNDPDGALRKLDKDGNVIELWYRFYEHPLIKRLSKQGRFDKLLGRDGKPSYIPSRNFALAFLDIISPTDPNADPRAFTDVRNALIKLPDSDIKKTLLVLIDDARDDLEKVRQNLGKWFDDAMERVSGWYARKAQMITLLVALVVTLAFNVDTIMISNSLMQDSTLRDSVVAAAEESVKKSSAPLEDINAIQTTIQQLRLPIGWYPKDKKADNTNNSVICYLRASLPTGSLEWASKIGGWLITIMAISLGAPLWFDILNKLVNLRSAGKKPESEKTPKETPE